VGLAGRDMFVARAGDVVGQVRILHLFTYNYDRVFPKTLDFAPALTAFTLLSTLACLLMVLPRVRHHAASLLCVVAVGFSAWCIDVYLVQLAPHWGQRETMVAYYQHRKSPKEKLVAYQMNWKGENFYTGNYMATWVSSGAKFKDWVKKQREKGVTAMYFTTEHSRLGTLKKELDNPKNLELLTDTTLNNKFFLARVDFEPLGAKRDSVVAAPKDGATPEAVKGPSRAKPNTQGD
jgi:hypothetical protein